MTAGELFKAGKLRDATEAQLAEVKAHPADQARRLFLFELLAFAGDLDRARKQLDLVQYSDLALDAAVLNYRQLITAEEARRQLWQSGRAPEFLAEAPAHVSKRLEAVTALREGRSADALRLLAEADSAAPAVHGQLNDRPFDLLRDADDVFGGVLEVMAHGKYYWVPVEQVQTLSMNPPKFPRDLIWVPARLEIKDAAGEVFLPALYPGSHQHADDAVKLGKTTDWQATPGSPVRGVGGRVFLVGEEPVNLIEWRQLLIEEPAAPSS